MGWWTRPIGIINAMNTTCCHKLPLLLSFFVLWNTSVMYRCAWNTNTCSVSIWTLQPQILHTAQARHSIIMPSSGWGTGTSTDAAPSHPSSSQPSGEISPALCWPPWTAPAQSPSPWTTPQSHRSQSWKTPWAASPVAIYAHWPTIYERTHTFYPHGQHRS
jgi:hypothetical protein